MIVCDTGPLVSAALSNDADHAACVRLFSDMHAAGRELLVPATVTAEVGYLLAREAGPRVESLFLASLAACDFVRVCIRLLLSAHGLQWCKVEPSTSLYTPVNP